MRFAALSILSVLLIALAPAAEAVGPVAAPPVADATTVEQTARLADKDDIPVLLDGEEVFRIQGGYVGSFGPKQRAENAEEQILRMARDPFYAKGLLTVKPGEGGAWLYYRNETIGFVFDEFAAEAGMTAEARATQVMSLIEDAVTQYRARRAPEELSRSAVLVLVATVVFALTLAVVFAGHRRLSARVDNRDTSTWVPRRGRLGFRDVQRFIAFQHRLLKLGRTIVVVVLLLIYLQVAFAIFPLTRSYAFAVLGYLVEPLEILWNSLLANVGDFFFIAVMVYLTRLLLRGLHVLLFEAARGAVTLPGLSRDRAIPLYKLLRILVVMVAAVMIYPYIPGSSSAAFQGISLFAGALFTLGASSTASNFIGGVVLVFSNSFRIGDRVEIGGVVGDVDESTLALTRIRTPKNELVYFANSNVLSSGFVNYSAMARRQGVIIHTSVTIGYDVPWRSVHELLLRAAKSTKDVAETPEPFVLQTALGDFSVAYEINAYTRQAGAMARVRSELHQNIQDLFAEAGVEIMSPTFAAIRDGSEKTIPTLDARAANTGDAEERTT